MNTTFYVYCPKCDRKTPHTNVPILGGYKEVCRVCGGVTDRDLDDDFDEKDHFDKYVDDKYEGEL